jgi:hypothetical protein
VGRATSYGAAHFAYSPKVEEVEFSELPLFGVLGSSAYRRAEDRAMLLLENRWTPLNLAAVHVVVLIRKVVVPTFTAIELVPLPPVGGPEK